MKKVKKNCYIILQNESHLFDPQDSKLKNIRFKVKVIHQVPYKLPQIINLEC